MLSSWKLVTSLPMDLQGTPINIVLKTLSSNTIDVQRISGCNIEGTYKFNNKINKYAQTIGKYYIKIMNTYIFSLYGYKI